MSCHLYGIVNCGSVKKARAFLESQKVDYVFHDFKKEAPQRQWLEQCLQQVDVDTLVNKRGTTWRKLSEEEQAQVATLDGAVALMLAYPNVIKRPVLWLGEKVVVGFDETVYQSLFQAA